MTLFGRVSLLLFALSGQLWGVQNSKTFDRATLSNGMELVTYESSKVPLVTIVLCSKAGAMTEDPDTNGLTHLWEHMFFKGNKKIPDQEAFNHRIRELGIVYNGDTGPEKVRYYFTLPSVYLKEGLEFMHDAISGPLLAQEELDREIKVVLNEYDRNASSPGFDLRRLRNRLIYGKLHYLRDALGDRDLITKTTREQLFRIKREVFVPGNSALLIAGDIDPKTIRGTVEKIFKAWQNPKGWKPKQPKAFPTFPKSQELVMINPRARNVTITQTFQGPRARLKPEDTYAADILISLLRLRTGKFYKTYMDSGLALHAGLSYYTQSQAGEVKLYTFSRADKALELKEKMKGEPQKWLNPGYFTKTQLEDVKRSLRIEKLLSINKPSAYIKDLAFWWAVTGLDYYEGYLGSLMKTELKDVRQFVKTYMIDKPNLMTIFLSPGDAKAIGLKDNATPLVKKFFKKSS